LWGLDGLWLVNILLKFFTVRKNVDSFEFFEIALGYLAGDFLIDLISTLPSMIKKHSRSTLIFRLIHIFELSEGIFVPKKISQIVFPNSFIKQNTLT